MRSRSGLLWLATAFLILITTIIALVDLDRMPDFLANLYNFPNGDKVGHFFLIGIMSFLANAGILALFPSRNPKRLILATSLILALLAGIEEWSQKNFPNRQASLFDFLSSLTGIVFFAWLAWLWISRSLQASKNS
jgi:polysaccharide biosynthesis protein VpsQ